MSNLFRGILLVTIVSFVTPAQALTNCRKIICDGKPTFSYTLKDGDTCNRLVSVKKYFKDIAQIERVNRTIGFKCPEADQGDIICVPVKKNKSNC